MHISPDLSASRRATQVCFSNSGVLKSSGLLSSVPRDTPRLRTNRHILGSSVWIDGHLKPDFYIKINIFFKMEHKTGMNFSNE